MPSSAPPWRGRLLRGIPALELLPTSAVPSGLHPPPLMPWYGLPRWVNALLWWLNDAAQNRLMGGPLNEARKKLGLPPVAAFTKHLFLDTSAVIAADEQLLPPDPAWNGRYPYAGFLFFDDPAPLDPALDAWLSNGEPPVYVGFGSMAGGPAFSTSSRRRPGGGCSLHPARRSSSRTARRRAFSSCERRRTRSSPRVAVAVHHGGSGTTASALRAGVPQVVLPMMLDQFHHAHHLRRAGLARKRRSS